MVRAAKIKTQLMSASPFFLVSYVGSDLQQAAINPSRWKDLDARPRTISLPLHSPEDERAGVKVTIVIGPNGSGKSTFVASLADELELMAELLGRTDEDSRRHRAIVATRATVEYHFNGQRVKLMREGDQLSVEVNGRPAQPDTVPFPSNVLAVAHLPADKFRFSRYQKSRVFYRYLGLRQATNLSTTGSLETAVIASLLAGRSSEAYQRALQGWLGDAGIGDDFQIELAGFDERAWAAHDLRSLLPLATAKSFLDNPERFFGDWGLGLDQAMMDRGLVRFLNQLRHVAGPSTASSVKTSRPRQTLLVPIRALSPVAPEDGVTLQMGFDLLRKARIARAVNLIVSKAGRSTTFSQLSSGERQILGTATRLIEHAVDGSVILIDEPEVSLHPTWQIAYVPRLLQALSHVNAAHVVIATHSHFMVSDIDDAASLTVAAADALTGRWAFKRFEDGVYGRTPENILYRVFGVGTASNFYVEQDLAAALQMISGAAPLNFRALRQMRAQLERVRGTDNPAFEEILRLIDQFLAEAADA